MLGCLNFTGHREVELKPHKWDPIKESKGVYGYHEYICLNCDKTTHIGLDIDYEAPECPGVKPVKIENTLKQYSVSLNAFGSVNVTVEANSPEEALKLAQDEADMSQGELDDWNYETPGEISDSDNQYWTIKVDNILEKQK